MAGVTIERSGGFSKEEHAINKLTRVAQWRSRCGTYVYLRQMPWHSPNTVSPSAKVPPCLPHEHHRQQGRPTARRSSNNLTASTSSSRHAASYHPFQVALAVRRWCPRAAPARAAAGSTPLRRRGSGVCSACAPRGAKRPDATIVDVEATSARSHKLRPGVVVARGDGSCRALARTHAFERAPSWRSSETCPKRSMQSSWALVAQGLSA